MTSSETEQKNNNESANEKTKVEIPDGFELITEGTVSMIYPKSQNSVFYNPVQVQNRDLSILMISLYAERRAKRNYIKRIQKSKKMSAEEAENEASKINWSDYVHEHAKEHGLRVLDALAASGLRSIRYFKEIPGVKKVIINDLESAAIDLAKQNIEFNKVPDDGSISTVLGDATALMYNSRTDPKTQFDVIDLDPYGSAAPFLDGAIQSVKDGGMLCVTCTDMAALGGSHPETCFGRYGSMPIQRAKYLQEFAVRILLQSLSRTANVYGRTIKPILSVGMAFYVRVFVEVYDDKAGVSQASTNIGHVYQSTQCDSFYFVRQGIDTGKNYQPGRTDNVKGNNLLKQKRKNKGTKKKNDKEEQSDEAPKNPEKTIEKNESTNGPILAPLPDPFKCPETGSGLKIGGPIWLERLHDFDAVEKAITVLDKYTENTENSSNNAMEMDTDASDSIRPKAIFQTHKPMHGLLTAVSEELPDSPLYYTSPGLCHTMHCSAIPRQKLNAAIRNAGYEVSAYHKQPDAIKTTAPPDVIWDIFRAWVAENPISKKWTEGKNENSAAARILKRGMVSLNECPKSNDSSSVEDEVKNNTKCVDFTEYVKIEKKKAVRFPMNPAPNWGPKPRAGTKRPLDENKINNNDSSGKKFKEEEGDTAKAAATDSSGNGI